MEDNHNRIMHATETMKKIDYAMSVEDKGKQRQLLQRLKQETDKYSMSTVCEKKELEFPLFNRSFNWFRIIKRALFKR
ncbi:MAG: hypothetical protein U5N58_03505 [Actinomycetota bacterium]|nr:hypothetical protein [Actinomycetota bacterium]